LIANMHEQILDSFMNYMAHLTNGVQSLWLNETMPAGVLEAMLLKGEG